MSSNDEKISKAQFIITVFDAGLTNLNKSFSLVDGEIVKQAAARMWKGKYSTHEFDNPQALLGGIKNLNRTQAPAIGICNEGSSGAIKAKDSKTQGAISRTKDNFGFSNCFVIDIDGNKLSQGEVKAKLVDVDPNLETAPLLIIASSSHGVHKVGEQPAEGTSGFHGWVGGVKDPKDIPRYGETFAKRCWLKGHGKIFLSASGAMHVRQLIDSAVFSPERLVFEAPPSIGKGLEQDERPFMIQDGSEFDTSQLKSLSAEEEAQYSLLVREAKLAIKPQAEKIKHGYIAKEVTKLVKLGVDKKQAKHEISMSLESNELYGHQLLYFQKYGAVTVFEVLKNPDKYDGCTLADPFEPEYHNNDTSVAKFYANNDD